MASLRSLCWLTLLAPGLLLAGCGDPCTLMLCPNDRRPSDNAINQCRAATQPSAPCSTQYRNVLICEEARRVCNASGKLDVTATLLNCTNELSALAACQK